MWENVKQCAHFQHKRLYRKERWKWKICFLLTASLNGDIVLSQPFVRCLDKSIYAEMFVTLFRFVPFVLFCFVPFIRRLFLTFCVLRTANSVVTCPWQRVCNVKYNVSKYVFKCDSPWNLVLATHTWQDRTNPIVFIPCTAANVSNTCNRDRTRPIVFSPCNAMLVVRAGVQLRQDKTHRVQSVYCSVNNTCIWDRTKTIAWLTQQPRLTQFTCHQSDGSCGPCRKRAVTLIAWLRWFAKCHWSLEWKHHSLSGTYLSPVPAAGSME